MSPLSFCPGICGEIRQIPLSYDKESEISALRLILALFPGWEHDEGAIDFIPFKDGITNTVYS